MGSAAVLSSGRRVVVALAGLVLAGTLAATLVGPQVPVLDLVMRSVAVAAVAWTLAGSTVGRFSPTRIATSATVVLVVVVVWNVAAHALLGRLSVLHALDVAAAAAWTVVFARALADPS